MSDINQNIELKGIAEDIINGYISFINIENIREKVNRKISNEYMKGLEEAEIKFNMNFMPDYNTLEFIKKFSFDNIKSVETELKDKLRKELVQALLNGEGVSQIKERINNVFDVAIDRAKTIAVTESNRAFNMGHHQAAKETGLKLFKQWSAQRERISKSGNEVPCSICEEMDGKIVGMDDYFKFSDGTHILLPPKHPNCACTILYVSEKIKK